MRGLIQRLQARTAQTIHRRAAGLNRQASHQPNVASDVEGLFALLLGVAHHNVFDFRRIDASPIDQRLDHGHGQIIRANVTEDAFSLCPAYGRSHAIDHYCVFHVALRDTVGCLKAIDPLHCTQYVQFMR